jgi:hypothetical protein
MDGMDGWMDGKMRYRGMDEWMDGMDGYGYSYLSIRL